MENSHKVSVRSALRLDERFARTSATARRWINAIHQLARFIGSVFHIQKRGPVSVKTPEFELERARSCLHSTINCGVKPLNLKQGQTVETWPEPLPSEPDYTCNLTDPTFTHPNTAPENATGQPCRLLTHGVCTVREQFPAMWDH